MLDVRYTPYFCNETLRQKRLIIIYLVATPKALRTGAHPGLTRALSTRLKLSLDPLIYAFDSPGVMVPFMGHGDRGSERGVKLALIGESLFNNSTLFM